MVAKEKVEELIKPKLEEGDYFVVSLDISTGNKIKLLIDSMEGITIEECIAFSRAIEHNLDRDVEDFELEVSSPGLDMPLKVKQQYKKNIGRELDLLMDDGSRIKGELKEVSDEGIIIHEEKKVKVEGHKKKQLIKTNHTIDFNKISKAIVVIKF